MPLIADRHIVDPAAPRSGRVEVKLVMDVPAVTSGAVAGTGAQRKIRLDTSSVSDERGAAMMAPVLGDQRTEEVIRRVNALEAQDDVRALRPFEASESH